MPPKKAAKAAPKATPKAAPAPKPTHRSVSYEHAKEIGKDRLGLYVGSWVRALSSEVAAAAKDDSRNALFERLLVAEADRIGVEVPEKARADVAKK